MLVRRKRRKILWGCAALLLLLIPAALALPWLLYRIAHARLEKAVGPLRAEGFVLPTAPPTAAGPRLLAATRRVQLSEPETKLLGKSSREGLSAALANRPQLMALFAKNREPLQQACSLEAGPSSLNIDYIVEDAELPNFLPELFLARMTYLQGLLALKDHDHAAVAHAARCLSTHAALLEKEPALIVQVIGLSVEKLQIRLLVQASAEPPAAQESDLSRSLPANDLRERYRQALALSATQLDRGIHSMLEKLGTKLTEGDDEENQGALAVGTFAGRWIGKSLGAAALDRYRLHAAAYDHDYAWIHHHLVRDPKEMSFWEKAGRIGGPAFDDLPATYRATAAARELLTACLAARSSAFSCGADHGRLRSVRNPDGSCTLRTADARDYLRFFGSSGHPVPQECTVPAR